jgi:hypothetical protein
MNTDTHPKSIEGTPYRWLSRPLTVARVDGRTYKSGGKVAILNCPVPGWTDVQVYAPDEEDWWDNVPSDSCIRAAVRGPSRRGDDLIAYALPLRNQPSALQAYINSLQPQQLALPEPPADHDWAAAFTEGMKRRSTAKGNPKPSSKELGRMADRRPHGRTDENLMLMLERIANARDAKVCDVINDLLREGVNRRLQS